MLISKYQNVAVVVAGIFCGSCQTTSEPQIPFVEVTTKPRPANEVKSKLVNALQSQGYQLSKDSELILEFDDPTPMNPVATLMLTCNSCPVPRYSMKVVVTGTPQEVRVRSRHVIIANPGTPLQREVEQNYKPETAIKIRTMLAGAIN